MKTDRPNWYIECTCFLYNSSIFTISICTVGLQRDKSYREVYAVLEINLSISDAIIVRPSALLFQPYDNPTYDVAKDNFHNTSPAALVLLTGGLQSSLWRAIAQSVAQLIRSRCHLPREPDDQSSPSHPVRHLSPDCRTRVAASDRQSVTEKPTEKPN